jgi:ATP-binding cassette subfamily G (WHITE) protein 2 (SNQ2)
LLFFTERNTSLASSSTVTLFKRGAKTSAVTNAANTSDEESKRTGASRTEDLEHDDADAIAAQPKMHDVFSWQHLDYTVPVGHGEMRQLLDDVSGYVIPGKLTALMGESGAGKVSSPNMLPPVLC